MQPDRPASFIRVMGIVGKGQRRVNHFIKRRKISAVAAVLYKPRLFGKESRMFKNTLIRQTQIIVMATLLLALAACQAAATAPTAAPALPSTASVATVAPTAILPTTVPTAAPGNADAIAGTWSGTATGG